MALHASATPRDRPRTYGRFYLRAFVSIMMIGSLLAFTSSGAALFVAPSGQMAQTIGWSLGGLGKGQWETLHVAFGCLWLPLAVLHLVYNRRAVTGYLRDRVRRAFVWRRELLAGIVVTASLGLAAVLDLPPVAQLMAWEASFNDVWAERSPAVVGSTTAAGTSAGIALERGGGIGRYATVDPDSGAIVPVGKEAAARTLASDEGEAAAD